MGNSQITEVTQVAVCDVQIRNIQCAHSFYLLEDCIADCILGFDFQHEHGWYARPDRMTLVLPTKEEIPFLTRHWANLLHTAAATATPETHFSKEVRASEHRGLSEAVMGTDLTQGQCEEIRKILQARTHQFTSKEKPLGCVKSVYHRIQPVGPPFMMKVKALSPGFRAVQKDAISKMLESGVLAPTVSAWGTTTTFAAKKTQDIRCCMNFCRLNKMDTIRDNYPLPRAPQLLEKFEGKQFFTTLDCAAGYWNIQIHPEDRHYTAVICEEGHFEYTRMTFGLRNAPATFQRLMDKILRPFPKFAQAYLDDVIIFSDTFEEHLEHIKLVIDAVHAEGFLFRLSKCFFAMPEVEYLGHYIGRHGVRMNKKKLMEISSFPKPTTVKQVQSFIGLTGYYRKFIRNYSAIAAPLTELTKKQAPWQWTEKEQSAFNQLLKAFEDDVVLHHPNYEKQFFIDTDASDLGIGAVLTQFDNEGRERPVFFASRKLTPGERKWHIREKEALAIIYGCQTFRHHVLGTCFIVRTDHESLKWIMDAKTGRIARWGLLLSEYEPFEVHYRKGELNKVADAFSRIYEDSECLPDDVFCATITFADRTAENIHNRQSFVPPKAEIKRAQAFDAYCIRKKSIFQKAQQRQQSGKTRSEVTAEQVIKPFSYHDGILGISVDGYFKPLLPRSMVADAIKAIHENPLFAHMGVKRTCTRLTDTVVAPGARKIAKTIIGSCLGCLKRKTIKPKHGFLKSQPPTRVHQQISMDFCGPYKTSENGYQYVLVIIDQFTKWVELIPCKSATAAVVLDAFYKTVICRSGVPEQLLTDNGSHFRNYLVEILCQVFGCFKAYSAPYYPEGDGQAERFMRNLNDSLSILCDQNVDQWESYIPGIQYAYNTTKHSVTNITPFEMVYGKKPQPLSLEFFTTCNSPSRSSQRNYVHKLKNIIHNVQERAKENILRTWINMAERYNKGRKEIKIKQGHYVLVRLNPSNLDPFNETGNKLAMRWSNPAQVVGTKTNGKTFDVRHQDGRVQVVNATQLLQLPQACWAPTKFTFQRILQDVESAQTADQAKEHSNTRTWIISKPAAQVTSE